MKNAEWLIKKGIQFRKVGRRPCSHAGYESIGYYDTYGNFNECYKGKFLGDLTSESILTWLDMEHKEPILDDAEKRYLSAVIRPFKNRVDWISKVNDKAVKKYFIQIYIDTNGFDDVVCLPYFDGSDMYKGMESDKKYSLEELGL